MDKYTKALKAVKTCHNCGRKFGKTDLRIQFGYSIYTNQLWAASTCGCAK